VLGTLFLLAAGLAFFGCTKKDENKAVKDIIAQAEKMTFQELLEKAYAESNGKEVSGIGNSSRGKTAGEKFVEEIKKIHPDYTGSIKWSQPKNNSIFEALAKDTESANPVQAVTLIQDAAQIKNKMLTTGILYNFIPKEWREASGVNIAADGNPLALQTLSKVFMYNVGDGSKKYMNVWDFVKEGEKPMFMGLDSEPVGKNFLYMLTEKKYIKYVKDAYQALSAEDKAYFDPIIREVKPKVKELNLTDDAEYSLAWIKLFVTQFNKMTDDGPISTEIVKKSAAGQTALIVYSKLRSINESEETSVNNIAVAAYQDGYEGFGGYAYKHYLQIPKNTPYPWTACAFISYMVTNKDGFQPWGKDMGGYSSNPSINQDHSRDGYVDGVDKFPAKDDRGYSWWVSPDFGRLVIEETDYCASVQFSVGLWIDSLKK
ncbi:MAG: hypothetical protein ACFNX0_07505, partial [Treponema sp.]